LFQLLEPVDNNLELQDGRNPGRRLPGRDNAVNCLPSGVMSQFLWRPDTTKFIDGGNATGFSKLKVGCVWMLTE